MTSYQVTCSVTRPLSPTSTCQVVEFQNKAQHHTDAVFKDQSLTTGSNSQQVQYRSGEDGSVDETLVSSEPAEDNLMICAVVSKTNASFSGADNFQSRVKLPFFWCNFCPYDTESRASLLQHIVSQHSFMCRFCSFVALSRGEVIQHGLKQHVQFLEQFREQRMKACHLKRDLFQLHFLPESDFQQSRKRAAQEYNGGEEVAKPSSAKQRRLDGDSVPPMKIEVTESDEERSSGSDESADISLQIPTTESANTTHTVPQPAEETIVTTHVMENIVSSSSVELDVSVEKASPVTSDQAAIPLSQAAENDVLISNPQKDEDTIQIKQESHSSDKDFAHALGRKTAVDTPRDEQQLRDEDTSASLTPQKKLHALRILIKQEPEDYPGEMLDSAAVDPNPAQHHDSISQQGHVVSRSAPSPPLSNIKAETLQQQFEDSFQINSVQSILSRTSDTLPHPVQLISQTRNRPHVENFLINTDQSKSSGNDSQSSLSMLRHLLTQPSRQADAQVMHATQPDVGDESVGDWTTEREDIQQKNSTLKIRAAQTARSASTQPVSENFLLTPGMQQHHCQLSRELVHDDANPANVTTPGVLKADASASDDSIFPFIKEEPREDIDNCSVDYHLMRFSSPELGKTDGQMKPLSNNQESASQKMELPSIASPLPKLHKKRSDLGQRPNDISDEEHQQALSSLLTMSPNEKMKFYANLSLRDLLTMKTDICSGTPSDQGAGIQVVDGQGDVVWECSFCHFQDVYKDVVLSHRLQCHGEDMLEKDYVENWVASSMEDDHMDRGERKEGEGQGSGMNHPSTSSGCRYLSQKTEHDRQAHDRKLRVRRVRHFSNLNYSEDEFGSDSSSVPEDLDDENYKPPKNLYMQEVSSSEDEDVLSEEIKNTKPPSACVQQRSKPSRVDQHGQDDERVMRLSDTDRTRVYSSLYSCPYCEYLSPSAQKLRDHVKHAADSYHMLIIREGNHKDSVLYVCPRDKCDVSNTLFSDSHSYLAHVMQCQGQAFDAHRPSVTAAVAVALKKTLRIAGFVYCPINNCYFVSNSKDKMHSHLAEHVLNLHLSQMLLFRSVCTAMAKVYATVSGFDRYICYRCNAILMNIPGVLQHMKIEHKSRVRGVFLVNQKLENQSRGILVAIQCLVCNQKVPCLEEWFGHQCQHAFVGSSEDSGAYILQPSVVQFNEWLWRMPSHSSKTPAELMNTSSAASTTVTQLPLIHSILMAQPNPAMDSKTINSDPQNPANSGEGNCDNSDLTVMVECEKCQEFIPENTWKKHKCLIHAQNKEIVRDTDPGDKKLLCNYFPSSELVSPTDGNRLSHSRLLAALASGSKVSSPAQSAVAGQSTSTSHPSLLSLLTGEKHVPVSQSCRKTVVPPEPHPAGREYGMIRSLLTFSVKTGKEFVKDSDHKDQPVCLAEDPKPRPGDLSSPAAANAKHDSFLCCAESTQAGDGAVSHSVKGEQTSPDDVPGTSVSSASCQSQGTGQPHLMSFLRQQGNQMRQVLAPILDDHHGF